MRWRILAAAAVISVSMGLINSIRAEAAQEKEYLIESFEALEELVQLVSQGEGAFTGVIRLTADIEAAHSLHPIGSPEHMFLGTFDGGGHVISNLHVEGQGEFSGLFGYVGMGGSVRNLTLNEPYICGMRYTGGIAGYSMGTIENCTVSGGLILGKSASEFSAATGGVVGLTGGKVTGCINLDTQVTGRRNVGGIAGTLCAGSLDRCLSSGTVRSWDIGEALVGGVVGGVQTDGEVRQCIGFGEVRASDAAWVGGIAGGLLSGSMSKCVCLGRVSAKEPGAAAGFVARRAQVMACMYAPENDRAVGEGRQDGTYALDRRGMVRLAPELAYPLIGISKGQGV